MRTRQLSLFDVFQMAFVTHIHLLSPSLDGSEVQLMSQLIKLLCSGGLLCKKRDHYGTE